MLSRNESGQSLYAKSLQKKRETFFRTSEIHKLNRFKSLRQFKVVGCKLVDFVLGCSYQWGFMSLFFYAAHIKLILSKYNPSLSSYR